MPLISVIIPIYKVEKYLNKCVDSVLCQGFRDIEVILVNDGSPDSCPNICDEYEKKDSRIKVIHKKNGGLSDARNAGINEANGDYLMFLDSDDYWEGPAVLDNVVEKIKNNKMDVLIHGCKDYSCLTGSLTPSRTGYNHSLISSEKKEKVLEYLFTSGLFPGSAWITVTRRDFIIKNNIFFITGIKAEDIDWLLNVFLNAESYASIDDTFYIYLKYRNDSITGTADIKSIKDVLFILDKWSKRLKLKEFVNMAPYIYNHLSYHYLVTMIIYSNLPVERKVEARKMIKKYKYLLTNSNSFKVRAINNFYSILGLSITSKLISRYYQIQKKK